MMAGALRADGQRGMIGDTMKEPKAPRWSSGATRELPHPRGQIPFRARLASTAVLTLIQTGDLSIIDYPMRH